MTDEEKASETLTPGRFSEEELAEWADPPAEETVKVGKKEVRIRAITDATTITAITREVEARLERPVEIDGKAVRLLPGEILLYTWLHHGLVEPKLTMAQIYQLSRRAAVGVVLAGQRVMELSGATEGAVDEEKKGSGRDSGPSPGISEPTSPGSTSTGGGGESSPPAVDTPGNPLPS